MRRVTILVLIIGIVLVIALVVGSGSRQVAAAFASAGWGVACVVLVRFGVMGLTGWGWWLLMSGPLRPPVSACILLRLIREGINVLLPVVQVGGDIAGARLLALRGLGPSVAAASVVTDLFLQVSTQFLFTALGLAMLMRLGLGGDVTPVVLAGMALAAPLLGGFFLIQRGPARRAIQAGLKRFAAGQRWSAVSAIDALYDSLASIQSRRGAVFGGALAHMAAWLIGSLEVYIALHFMGYPVSLAEAAVIESLGQAIRGAAFAVPGAIGVQEGGLIVLCGLFGIPAEPALALSFVKRVADLAVGVPGLISWQIIEGRQALTAKPELAAATRPAPEGANGS